MAKSTDKTDPTDKTTDTDRTDKPGPETAGAPVDPGGILVTCPSGPRRRAGMTFGPVETHIPAADLSEATLAAIVADALLVVRPFVADAPNSAE